MTLERWKLMAGVFGIAIVGVVAMANPQCPGKTANPREKAPESREVQAKPSDMPKTAAVTAPAEIKLAPPMSTNVLPEPAPRIPDLAPIQLPGVGVQTTAPTPPTVALPTIRTDTVIELPLPGVAPTLPAAPVPSLNAVAPKPEKPAAQPATLAPLPTVPVAALPIPATPVDIPLTITPEPKPSFEPSKATTPPTVSLKDEVEMRVRVVVPLTKGQSKFEVLSGDTTLLQAACEQVEVRSPTAKNGATSPIKASGKVRFTAPGCEGTCDSLTVLPTTGEVELTGSVRVHCKQGQAETEIHAASMKFKLGSAPGVQSASHRASSGY